MGIGTHRAVSINYGGKALGWRLQICLRQWDIGNSLLLTSNGFKRLRDEFCLVFVQKAPRRRALLEYFLFFAGKNGSILHRFCASPNQSSVCRGSCNSSRCLSRFLSLLKAQYVTIAVVFSVRGYSSANNLTVGFLGHLRQSRSVFLTDCCFFLKKKKNKTPPLDHQ